MKIVIKKASLQWITKKIVCNPPTGWCYFKGQYKHCLLALYRRSEFVTHLITGDAKLNVNTSKHCFVQFITYLVGTKLNVITCIGNQHTSTIVSICRKGLDLGIADIPQCTIKS